MFFCWSVTCFWRNEKTLKRIPLRARTWRYWSGSRKHNRNLICAPFQQLYCVHLCATSGVRPLASKINQKFHFSVFKTSHTMIACYWSLLILAKKERKTLKKKYLYARTHMKLLSWFQKENREFNYLFWRWIGFGAPNAMLSISLAIFKIAIKCHLFNCVFREAKTTLACYCCALLIFILK